MPSHKEDYVFGVILTAGRSRASASGESKARFKRVDGADRMQMLGSISYVSPASPRLAASSFVCFQPAESQKSQSPL